MLIPGACEYGSRLAEQQPGGSGTLGAPVFPLEPGRLACPIFEASRIRGELEDQREEIEDTLNMDSLAQCHENHAGIGMPSRNHRIVIRKTHHLRRFF